VNRGRSAVHFFRSFVILVLTISLFVTISACALQPADCAREEVFCVGLVTAYNGVDDHGLNQAAWESLQNHQTQAGITRLDVIESVDTRDWEKNVSFFAERNYDVVVTVGRNLSETTVAVAAKYSSSLFIGIDQQLDDEYANIASIYFDEGQAGFLAGILAAMVTKADEVGAVCEASGIDDVWRYCEGFRAGVNYENEDVLTRVTYRENGSLNKTFNDPEWGEGRAISLIDGGIDVLTGFGGNTAQGAFLKSAEKGIPIIGAEEDLYFVLPDVQPVLITSIVNDPSVALSYLVSQASQGEILVGPYPGQVTITPFRGLYQDLEKETGDVLQGIRKGDIEVNIPEKK